MARPCQAAGNTVMPVMTGPMPSQTSLAPVVAPNMETANMHGMQLQFQQGMTEWSPEVQQMAIAQMLHQVPQNPDPPPGSIPLDSGSTASGSSTHTTCWPNSSKRPNNNLESHIDSNLEAAVVAQALAGDISVTAPPVPTQMDRDA